MSSTPISPVDAWTSTHSLPELAAWLKDCRRVVILTHVKPDGDAAGSSLALARALSRLNIDAAVWYFGPQPDWLKPLARDTKHLILDDYGPPASEPDAIVIVDTGAWTQLHEIEKWLRERTSIAAVIDHHRNGDPDVAARRFIETDAAAVCEPIAELSRLLLSLPSVSKLPVDIAEPLYLGIATDTGWFRHSNVTPGTMRIAADLIQAGVDHASLYRMIEQQNRTSRLKLLARALTSLELRDNDTVALMTLTQQDFHDCRATPNDTAGFVDAPMSAASVIVSAVLTEAYTSPKENPHNTYITKISLRSKDGPGAVDVNAVAQKLGGGGHIRAAGAKLALPLDQARLKVIEALG